MSRFRPTPGPPGLLDEDLVPVMDLVDILWRPAHFFVDPALILIWEFTPREETPWEMYQGRLLDPRHCSESRVTSGWNIYQVQEGKRSDEPLISLKLDWHARTLHVMRAILIYAWEAQPDQQGIVEGSEVLRWQRELVGSLVLADFESLDAVRDEIICLLWQAVVGTSRLPLASVETPLPAFSFGQLHYLFREELPPESASLVPLRDWQDLLKHGLVPGLGPGEQTRLLEFTIRCTPNAHLWEAAQPWRQSPGGKVLPSLRRMFNEISLSPYTDFVTKTLSFVEHLVKLGALTADEEIDFLAHLSRQNHRHLLAYDLITFHNRGANYPDALLLEEVLPRFFSCLSQRGEASSEPALETAKNASRLSALAQGCLLIHRYRNHAVPDAPTSQGENARVMPPDMARVPSDQLEQPNQRRRLLFADWDWKQRLGDLGTRCLRSAVLLLDHEDTFVELGTAIFIDRPFGSAKASLEPDQTLLIAHQAFSLALANAQVRRWRMLLQELGCALSEREEFLLRPRLSEEMSVQGVPIAEIAPPSRPVPSLADAARTSPDFIVLRTLPGSVRSFLEHYGALPDLNDRPVSLPRIVARVRTESGSVLALFDANLSKTVQFEVDSTRGFRARAGIEFPRSGFQVHR